MSKSLGPCSSNGNQDADLLENFMETTSEINPVISGENKRFTPIRLFIHSTVSKNYQQISDLPNEIKRCFPNQNLTIEFAYIQDRKVTIVTNDQATHSLLSGPWPEDAFSKGITPSVSKELKNYKIILLGLPISLDLSTITKELNDQGINKTERLISRSNNTPTSIVNAETTGSENYKKLLTDGFRVGLWSKRYKVSPKSRIQQCYNCLCLGHLKHNCDKPKKCIKCSFTHDGDWTYPTKCYNCEGNHTAVSRKCDYLKTAEKDLIKSKHDTKRNLTNVKKPETNARFDRKEDLNTPNKFSFEQTNNLLDDKIKSILTTHLDKLESRIEEIINEQLERIIARVVEPIIETIYESLVTKIQRSEFQTPSHQQINPTSSQAQTNKPTAKNSSKSNLLASVEAAISDKISKRKSFDNKNTRNENNRKSMKRND